MATNYNCTSTDDTSKTLDQWTSDEDTSERETVAAGPLLALLQPHQQEYEGSSSGDFVDPGDYPGTEANFHPEDDLDPGDSTENDDFDEDDDYENDLDLDSEEDEDSSEEAQNNERVKRKIMLGGGGSYSGVSRRRGGGDPYGRRRDNHNYHGPDYGGYYDSWPQRDRSSFDETSSYGTAQTTSSASASSSSDPSNSGVVYGTPVGSSASSITGTSRSSGASHTYANTRSSVRDSDVPSTSGRKSKTGRREIKQKLSKSLKWEIAEFAIQHGTHRTAEHYAEIVDRRLTPKKIEKFVNRYQKRHQKTQKRQI